MNNLRFIFVPAGKRLPVFLITNLRVICSWSYYTNPKSSGIRFGSDTKVDKILFETEPRFGTNEKIMNKSRNKSTSCIR